MTRILVIDDHPIVIQGCQRLFTDVGMRDVLTASSFSDAFRKYRREKPDIILVDLAINSVTSVVVYRLSGGFAFTINARRCSSSACTATPSS